jgi:peptidoglycan/xylan/chitin deacetylase (PgdA/CDA1 family)
MKAAAAMAVVVAVLAACGPRPPLAHVAVQHRTHRGLSEESWRVPITETVIPVRRRAVDVPILEYHYIRKNVDPRDGLGFRLSVTPSHFSAQMNWLDAHGYHPVTFDDLREYFAGTRPLPSRPVVLTFDDGYEDFYTTAEPILRRHNFRSVAYVVPGFWGRQAYMTAAQVSTLDRSGLVEIASHTVDHVDLAIESGGERAYELDRSRDILEHLLGHAVLDFCYPSGEFGNGAVGAVAAAGYSTATTEMPGSELTWSSRLMWPRVRVNGGETLAEFVAALGRPEPFVTLRAPHA